MLPKTEIEYIKKVKKYIYLLEKSEEQRLKEQKHYQEIIYSLNQKISLLLNEVEGNRKESYTKLNIKG